MKVSELWLREWANPALDAQQLAASLTMAGLEVDEINSVAGQFDKVVVAHVLSTKPHPQADKLTLCEVDYGSESPLKIVCGAANVRPGLKVALALNGATLPNGMTIKETKLRGEPSQGMLCSASELGLTDTSDGIIELDEEAPLGEDLRQYLNLNDHVFDIDLTPNRADCLSVLGVAREVAALNQATLIKPVISPVQPDIDEQIPIELQAQQACPQYCGRVIRKINSHAKTPVWMRERLRRAGLRAIHPVVDVTNYVMLELGQPMHAFDKNKIQGKIIVRLAKEQEQLTLLGDQTVELSDDILVIADSYHALAMAGVMGGADSAVDENVTDIFLESAYFSPQHIAGVARRYGLNTDSAQRFERGVDPTLQVNAMERATALLKDIVGGQVGPLSIVSVEQDLPKIKTIQFNPGKVKKLTGLDIAENDMVKMLQGLGMMVDQKQSPWQVVVPSHRFDVSLDVDLVEEIIRVYGYDRIPGEKMVATVQSGSVNATELLGTKIAQFFSARGYNETINYSFIDPALQSVLYPDQQAMTLLNPISPELSQMRLGMWPGLIAAMIHNIHRQQPAVKLFERGVIFEFIQGQLQESPCIAGLLTGETGGMNWLETARKLDFYDAKGELQALFNSLKLINIQFINAQHPALHPGKSAQIEMNGQKLGWCGVLHPRVANELDVADDVVLFEFKLESIVAPAPVRYQAISKFPSIRRDLSLLVDKSIPASDIEKLVRQVINADWLKSLDIFDVYSGESIPQGKKSLAVALILQDTHRTLVDVEINHGISAIIKKLDQELGITLRE